MTCLRSLWRDHWNLESSSTSPIVKSAFAPLPSEDPVRSGFFWKGCKWPQWKEQHCASRWIPRHTTHCGVTGHMGELTDFMAVLNWLPSWNPDASFNFMWQLSFAFADHSSNHLLSFLNEGIFKIYFSLFLFFISLFVLFFTKYRPAINLNLKADTPVSSVNSAKIFFYAAMIWAHYRFFYS